MIDLKQRIIAAVETDLQEIEKALSENLNPYYQLVSDVAGHILFSGGKRLRPLLMVLCARLCGYQGTEDKKFSTIFEYLHAATLLHDDIVDGADIRRGRKVAHKLWDNPTTVLTGDFLLARGLSIAAQTGLNTVIQVIAGITESMSQGEIRQLEKKGNIDLSEAEYMDVIERKTAVLFRGACKTGALIAGASKERADALAAYGYHLGMAFQMADDLLDYTLDSKALGKETGADLKEGKLTLPVIHALKDADQREKDQIIGIIKNADFSENDFQTLIEMLNQAGGIAYTKQLATRHVEEAKDHIADFQGSESKAVLKDIADYALARKV